MRRLLLPAALAAITLAAASPAHAARSLTEYRHFRALVIDLAGRLPTRAELAAFEKPDFDLEKWIDGAIGGDGYAKRIRRAYMDLLRLDVGGTFAFRPSANVLRRQTILGPDGKKIYVYYRNGQRRAREATDGVFCLTKDEVGAAWTTNGTMFGALKNVDAAALAANTVVVKPWWLYRDYAAASPKQLYGVDWTPTDPSWALIPELLKDGDGTATTEVRVCKEEASTATTGTVFATGRTKAPPAGTPPPYERLTQLPLDDAYATANKGKPIACDGGFAYSHTNDCGCGVGLERCMPAAGNNTEPAAFQLPGSTILGIAAPTSIERTTQSGWHRQWWSEEAVKFLEYLAREDRDFREVLTSKATVVNGPLAQFYKYQAGASCCGRGGDFGYVNPEPLLDPAKLPSELKPHDASTWKVVEDRGPNASGILTMPVFLTKYGTRRGRAHVLYNVFQCRQFVAEEVKLEPSTEPDLTKRSGCATCHATLEPMSAFFTRVQESDWTWLPASRFPLDASKCRSATPTKMSSSCRSYYDPAFTTAASTSLRGAYGSPANAEAGPAGLAKQIADSPEFAKCVVANLTASFLGRGVGPDDAAMVDRLVKDFVDGGYKLKPLIRSLVHEPAYANANNLSSDAWRASGEE